MVERWNDLEALRLSLQSLQKMLALLQIQTEQLREAIDFRLEPLTQEIEELQQRYETELDA